MTLLCGRTVVQVLVARMDIGVVIYEAVTSQCGRSVVQVLVVRVDIGVVTYETPVWEVSGSGSVCQCGFKSGDLSRHPSCRDPAVRAQMASCPEELHSLLTIIFLPLPWMLLHCCWL